MVNVRPTLQTKALLPADPRLLVNCYLPHSVPSLCSLGHLRRFSVLPGEQELQQHGGLRRPSMASAKGGPRTRNLRPLCPQGRHLQPLTSLQGGRSRARRAGPQEAAFPAGTAASRLQPVLGSSLLPRNLTHRAQWWFYAHVSW